MHPGRRTLCNYGRTPAKAGLCKAEGPREGDRGSKNDNPERRADYGALLQCCRFLLLSFPFAPLPKHSLLQPPTPGLAPASLFFGAGKKKLTGALNLRAGGLLAGLAERGDSDRAASYLMKFVLPAAWTKTPGAAVVGGTPASPASSGLLAPRPPPPSRARSTPPTPTTASFQYGILSVRMPGTLF